MRKGFVDVDRLLRREMTTYGFTHALRIPLATLKSRPYLERSLRLFKSDPAASHIHPAAFAPPDMQYLNLGSLCLSTAGAEKRAIELLEGLKLDHTLYESTGDKDHLAETLRVSIAGLLTPNYLKNSNHLHAPVIDHTGRLSSFIQIIQGKFISAKLMVKTLREGVPKPILQTSVIGNKMVRSTAENRAPHIQRRLSGTGVTVKQLASWDLRNLYNKYRDHTWAENFPLQRLTIAEVKSRDIWKYGEIIGRGCPELASVPLPGIKHLEQDAALEDVTYEGYERIFV